MEITCALVIFKKAFWYHTHPHPQLLPQSQAYDVPPSPCKEPTGQPYKGRVYIEVHRAESKYPTLQLVLSIGQHQELFYLYTV